MISRRTKWLGLSGTLLLMVRFAWIQAFRFEVIHRLNGTPARWEAGSIWVGGPLGWQSYALKALLILGVALVGGACLSLFVDLLRRFGQRSLRAVLDKKAQ